MKRIFVAFFLTVASLLSGQDQDHTLIAGDNELAEYFAGELRALSHDSMQGRGTLTPGIRKAELRIINELQKSGIGSHPSYDGYTQVVPLLVSSGPEDVYFSNPKGKILSAENILTISGRDLDMEAATVFIDRGTDIETFDLEGKWVITLVGNGKDQFPGAWLNSGKEKAAKCYEQGALGLIEIYETGKMPWQMLRSFQRKGKMQLARDGYDFPHFWINPVDSTLLRSLTGDETNLGITITGMINEIKNDHNIIGYLPGKDSTLKDEIILLGAHYDHVGIGRADKSGDSIYNGARDNAVGVATLLGLARYFSDHGSPRPLLFVFFTAEERGLLGSKYFVDNCPVPYEKIRFNFNCDNGGYTDTDMITVVGFQRLDGLEKIDEWIDPLGLRHFEPEMLGKRLFYASDNIHFARRGIPAASFSMGFTAMDQRVTKYYHQPADHWENFDRNYMTTYWSGIEKIASELVRLDTLPFWKKSEDFYEKGIELYGKDIMERK